MVLCLLSLSAKGNDFENVGFPTFSAVFDVLRSEPCHEEAQGLHKIRKQCFDDLNQTRISSNILGKYPWGEESRDRMGETVAVCCITALSKKVSLG